MSGLGDNLGKFLHPARNRPVESAPSATEEPSTLGDKLRPRISPGMFRMKSKSPEEQDEADSANVSANAKNATRASLLGRRG